MEPRTVSLREQTILALIPLVYFYAFLRIEKLKMGIVILFVTAAINIGFEMVLPFPYYLIATLPISFVIPVYYVRKWSKAWNDNHHFSNLDD